ncbi:MAG: hypothetical protein IT436_19195 [Phycisphaerales bacterium]|nr:hypothetical protein [Phycisphaerales bacterium]
MTLLDDLRGWWTKEQTNWTLVQVAPPPGPAPEDALPPSSPVRLGKAYLTVRMRSMAIGASRKGWNLFHAALHSQMTLDLRDGSTAVIQTVLAPDFLRELDPKRLQNVLHIDRTIFGPAPYSGGPLAVSMGVLAVKHADLATPFLNILEELGTAAGVAFIGAATPFIGPIRKGVELLTGTADATSLEIALVRELNPPTSGWYALVRLPGGSVKPEELSVVPDNFELRRHGKPLPGVPYLVYSVDATSTRPDWAKIPELKAAYKDFTGQVVKNKRQEADEAVKVFSRVARICPELLAVHAEDVVSAVKAEYRRAFEEDGDGKFSVSAPTKGPAGPAPGLDRLQVRFRAP